MRSWVIILATSLTTWALWELGKWKNWGTSAWSVAKLLQVVKMFEHLHEQLD